jgi:hypothetical protein
VNESEWLKSTEPQAMLEFLRGKTSDRKLRLFAVACCRRIWHLLGDEGSRQVVVVAERRADGESSSEEILAGMKQANVGHIQAIAAMMSSGSRDQTDLKAKLAALYTLQPDTSSAVRIAIKCAAEAMSSPRGGVHDPSECLAPALMAEKQAQADLLRCIFAKPFRSVALAPAWRPPSVVSLAQAAYEERALPSGELEPARLSVLADALEETGCDTADILSHLRGPGPHVRGCWAGDLLLGRE